MAFDEFWWSSVGGGPDPDPGFPIAESLRFSGDAYLTSIDAGGTNQFSVPAGDFTLSMWVKVTATATDNQSVYSNNDSSRGFKISTPGSESTMSVRNGGLTSFGGGSLRAPAAWYNFVFQCESNVVTCWQNGVEYPDTPAMFDRTGEVLIGCGQATDPPDEALRGYMAQIVCLDGTLEPPESFGRNNNDNVWVPVEIENAFTAEQYGTNGFWLTFNNINNVGEDSAPIGATGHTVARNFRGVGFDTMPPGRFSENLAASAAGAYQATPANRTLAVLSPEQAFDGNLATQAQANGSAAWIYWTTSIACTSVTLIVNNDTDQTANTTRINGTQVVTPAATLVGSNFEQTFPVAGGTLTEFAFMNQGGPNTSIFGMRVDNGQVLEDNDGTGFDPMTDSPTQNFATGNAINNPTATFNAVPVLGNLGNNQSSGGVQGGLQPTMPWDANAHLFFEVIVSNYPFNSWFGFNGNPGPNAQTGTIGAGISNGIINWSMNGGQPLNSMTSVEGPFTGITWTPNYTVQENVVAGWEWDGPNRRIRYYENGTLQSTSSQWAAGAFDTANFFFGYNNSPNAPWTYNFGQQPMTNPPADTIRLQTNDLPELTILNGRTQFQAITDTGANILTAAQTAFDTGLWWVKNEITTNEHQLVDSVRGAGTAFTCPGSLTQNYDPPDNDSIAWCWNLLGSPATNGFNIIQYTGNSNPEGTNTQNVAHNLGGTPDFFINFRAGDTVDARTPWVWHGSAPVANQRFQLNDSVAGSTLTNFWGQPDATNLVFGPGDNTNANGFDFITYVWRAVPGYSDFGLYTGNSDASGPFIYTGFRPAFVMIKSTGVESWYIRNSTSSPTNPVNSYFVANTTAEEQPGTDQPMDFLSNGFKLRTSNAGWNTNNQTYVYCAFAENPFGGSNVSPANAR